MDQQNGGKQVESNEDDEGFTMEFRIEVVDDIEAQVEEMMRLGALGYFKEARQLSQSIAPVHQQKFEVVFEQLRLMLDQGAYVDLIARAESYPEDACTPEQDALITLMMAISQLSMDDTGEPQTSDALWQSRVVDPSAINVRLKDRLKGGSWTTEELLEDILSLWLRYLGNKHEKRFSIIRDEKDYVCLSDTAVLLLEQEQCWAAKKLFQVIFLETLRNRRISELPIDILKRVQSIDESTFEHRLTKFTIAARLQQETSLYLGDSGWYKEIRISTGNVLTKLDESFAGENYGPRCTMYRQFAVLLNRYSEHIIPGDRWGKEEEEEEILKAIRLLQKEAEDYDDRTMHEMLNAFLKHFEANGSKGQMRGYRNFSWRLFV